MAEIPDTTGIDHSPRFDPVPRDKYPVEIVSSEKISTKAGDGAYLKLEHVIVSGPHAGRKLWNNLNLWNDNAQTVEIAKRQLAQICHSVEIIAPTDSEQLHHKAMLAHVKYIPEGKDKNGVFRDAKNEIGGYSPINQVPPEGMREMAASRRVMPAQENTPPWRRAKA